MKSLASLACGVFAAAGPADASAPLPVICPADAPVAFCSALSASIAQTIGQTTTAFATERHAESPFIEFVLLRSSDQILQGHLQWRTPSGATGAGPALELTSIDTAITAQMLSTFARQLVGLSDLPDMTTPTE